MHLSSGSDHGGRSCKLHSYPITALGSFGGGTVALFFSIFRYASLICIRTVTMYCICNIRRIIKINRRAVTHSLDAEILVKKRG